MTQEPIALSAYLDAGLSIADALPKRLRMFAEDISIDDLEMSEQRREYESQWVDVDYTRTIEDGPMDEDRWELATMRRWRAECFHDPALRLRALDALPAALVAEVLDIADKTARPYLATTALEPDTRGISSLCMTCGHAFEEGELVVLLVARCDDLESVVLCGACVTGLAEQVERAT